MDKDLFSELYTEVVSRMEDHMTMSSKDKVVINDYLKSIKIPKDYDISQSYISGTLHYYFMEYVLDHAFNQIGGSV